MENRSYEDHFRSFSLDGGVLLQAYCSRWGIMAPTIMG